MATAPKPEAALVGQRDELTLCGAAELARRIASGELSARDVVQAYVRWIEHVNPHINALVVPLLEQACRQAALADEAQAGGQPLGALHGVPVTIKECFDVAGTAATIGLTSRAGEYSAEYAILVRRLREAGAIVLGKTNVPQLMLIHETDNPLFGRTNNPWDLLRTPGGSSGGEAAIVAAGGSALGLGSDLGGSLRIPAHFCGIHSLKPTSGRLPRCGTTSALRGIETIQFQPGPMARRVEDLALGLQVLIGSHAPRGSSDCPLVALPDPGRIDVGQLRVGVWEDDDYFPVSPAVRRAVQQAAAALQQRGTETTAFRPPDLSDVIHLYYRVVSADGGADARRWLKGNPIDWRLQRLLRVGKLPFITRPAVAALLRMIGRGRTARMITAAGPRTADQFWQSTLRVMHYRRRFERLMEQQQLDAIIAPAHALPALLHGSAIDVLDAACYCLLPNLLGGPTGAVAATRVRQDEQGRERPEGEVAHQRAQQIEQGSVGMPVGVQVFAAPWQEEVVLAVMSAVEQHFAATDDYPLNCGPWTADDAALPP